MELQFLHFHLGLHHHVDQNSENPKIDLKNNYHKKSLKIWKEKRERGKSFQLEVTKVDGKSDVIKLINDSEEFVDAVEYGRLYDKYVGKYGLENSHKSPISDDKFFTIRGINKKNNKIIVGVGKDKPNNFQSREYDEEGFNLFLNQPELF